MTHRTPANPITVIAAACNEACEASEWLEHLSWADRIVVVDTGSTDGTPELLRAGGAEVVCLERPGGTLIHVAKNIALAKVGAGWVLDVDFDERVSLALRTEIEALRDIAEAGVAAYEVPFRHYVFGRYLRHGGWRTRHLRVYRAGRARYPEDRAHSTLAVDGAIGALDGLIVHFAHPTLHDFVTKMNRYTSQDAPLTLKHGRGGLRNRAPLPARRLRWLWASFSVFWGRYIKAAGFRDGMPGFLAAALLASYSFVEQAKVWEAQNVVPAAGGDGGRERLGA